MSESFMPVPDPEPSSNWDPEPARCSVEGCRTILQNLHSASRGDAEWEGWCPIHGTVVALYPSQESEMPDEDVA